MSDERALPDDDDDPIPQIAIEAEDTQRIRDRAKRRAAEETAFWKAVLENAVGRRCVWQFIESCHPFSDRFANGPNGFPQESATWYRAGERDCGLRFLRDLQRHDFAGAVLMQQEHDPQLRPPPKPQRKRKDEDV
jgi:hypothetical protein